MANEKAIQSSDGEVHTRVEVLGNIGPNWFASVMGTGIVAIAGATLPLHMPGLRAFTEAVWVVATALVAVLIVVVGGHWLRHPTVARSHARNPQMAHFYGAAPMALMTVGAGAMLVGRDLSASASPSTWTGCCGPSARSAGCSPR